MTHSTSALLDGHFAGTVADVQVSADEQSDAEQRILAVVRNDFQVAVGSKLIDQTDVSLQRDLRSIR